MIPRCPQKPDPPLLNIGRVKGSVAQGRRPQRQRQDARPRVPGGPMWLSRIFLIRVDGVRSTEHTQECQVVAGAMKLTEGVTGRRTQELSWEYMGVP